VRYSIVIAILMLFDISAAAQQSLFESSSGETAIFLSSQPAPGKLSPSGGDAGVVLYNMAASTVRFGYLHERSGSRPLGLGGELSGTLKDGSSTILHNNATAPGASIRVALTKSLTAIDASKVTKTGDFKCSLCAHWLVAQFRVDVSQFYTVPSSAPPFPMPKKRTFNGIQGKIGYNQLWKSSHADWLLGATIGIGRQNNTDALKSAQFTDNMITNTSTDQLILNQGSKTTYIGKYDEYIGAPINADAIVFPGALRGMVGFDLFVRSNVATADRYGSPGLGVFVAKKGQPARPIGGLTVAYRDGKGQASLVVGWSF
jgi:hypothetical protein